MITPILLYSLKVNLALAILYFGYRMLFQRDTFFRLKRGALLSVYLIAFLYQLPDVSSWLSTRASVSEMITYYSAILPKEIALLPADQLYATDWTEMSLIVLQSVYLIGVIILLIRCLIEISIVTRTYMKGKKITVNGIRICLLTKEEEPYSFFGWIFIFPGRYKEGVLNEILIHEQTHVKQLHSFDRVIGEIVSIICWMNPFAWLLKQEISINHEYMADERVMMSGYNKKEYQYHLIGLEHPRTTIMQLHNHFSVLPLKKRITMLNKKRTNSVRKVKYLALIPMAAGLLLLNNIDAMARVVNNNVTEPVQALATAILPASLETPIPPEDDKVYNVCDVMPEFPGGINNLPSYLAKSVKYPTESQTKGEQGKVSVVFVINKDGSITDARVIKSVTPNLDKEALRVIKAMPKWTPGKKDGKIVRVSYTVPVTFRLQ